MKKKEYLPQTWIDPRLYIKQSAIHGRGIFTNADIQKGEMVMIWGGRVVSKTEYKDEDFRPATVVPISDTHYLGIPSTVISECIDELLNHSCDSTCGLRDEVTMVARREIKKYEEITLDSALWDADEEWGYTDEGVCHCKSLYCRGKITAADWKRKDVQERYAGYFSPYIQEKIEQENVK